MKNVFIDSNIWLSLYSFSNDDLEQFVKLKELIGKEIVLLIPIQVRQEVTRNRDAKIKEALSKFEDFKFSFPTFCKNYDEYVPFSEKFNELKNEHRLWLKKIKEDIRTESLKADKVIEDFFSDEAILPCDSRIILRAEQRYKAGNPPGKDNKYGDAVNWECILENVDSGEDLYFISADKDYSSVIDDSRFNLFLQKEWNEKKSGKVFFYKSLVSFLKAHFADIQLKTEQYKDELIEALAESSNFANTHAIIAKMSKYTDWSASQRENIYNAAINNRQVNWIINDTDIRSFFEQVIGENNSSSELARKIISMFENGEDIEDEDDDIFPF